MDGDSLVVGATVLGVYEDEVESCVGRATVTALWYVAGRPFVRLCFDGNGTPDAYEGPAALLIHRLKRPSVKRMASRSRGCDECERSNGPHYRGRCRH